MGLAIIVPGVSFDDANLGKVTLNGNVPITGLYINLENSYTGTSVDLKCSYLPANTTQRNVVWSIEDGSEYASISGSLLTILSGASYDDVTVRCTSALNSLVYAEKAIKVTRDGDGSWLDFTNAMIVTQKSIDASDGHIQDRSDAQSVLNVVLLPIPANVTTLKLKRVGSASNEALTVSFVPYDNLTGTRVNANHYTNWNSIENTEISISLQSGDVSVVCWQQIGDTVYGIGNTVYKFE